MQAICAGIAASAPPEIPPDYPLRPTEPGHLPVVPMPMVYVESTERIEYRVLARTALEAKGLEADLNALGREGWWLLQIIPQEPQIVLVLARRVDG